MGGDEDSFLASHGFSNVCHLASSPQEQGLWSPLHHSENLHSHWGGCWKGQGLDKCPEGLGSSHWCEGQSWHLSYSVQMVVETKAPSLQENCPRALSSASWTLGIETSRQGYRESYSGRGRGHVGEPILQGSHCTCSTSLWCPVFRDQSRGKWRELWNSARPQPIW